MSVSDQNECNYTKIACYAGQPSGELDGGIVVKGFNGEIWEFLEFFEPTTGMVFWPTTITDNYGRVFIFWIDFPILWFNSEGDVNIWFSYMNCTDNVFSTPEKITDVPIYAPGLSSDNYNDFSISSGAFPAISYNEVENKIYIATQSMTEDDFTKNIHVFSSSWIDDETIEWELLTTPGDGLNNELNQILPWIATNEIGKSKILYYEYESGSNEINTMIIGTTTDFEFFDISPIKLNSQINNGDLSPKFEYNGTSYRGNDNFSIWVDFESPQNQSDVIISHITSEQNMVIDGEFSIAENSVVKIMPYSTIFIEENSTFVIEKGTQLNFGENASIEVYGELIINGEESEEVEFTSEAGDYNIIAYEGSKLTFNHVSVENADRIVLWNQSEETTFTNCTFDNNGFVLAIEGQSQFNNCTFSNNDAGLVTVSMTYPVAMPTVENCTFINNRLTGMLSGYRSIPILKGNEFINNDDGLRVSFGSEPYLFTNGADCESQNNLFEGNNVGVRVYNSGLPWLGIYADGLTAFEGYNRLGNNIWDIYSENIQYPIYAQKNHWQNDPNNLCESGSPTVYGDVITDPTISGDSFNNIVHNAINNEVLGDYILAASQYVALVMEDPDSEIVKWAIAGLVRTYTKMNRKADLLTLLDQIAQDYPGTIAFKYASTHQITQLIDNGNYDEALDQILLLEGFYPQSELSPKHLFEEWIIAEKTNGLSRSGQSKVQIAEKLIAEYPEDDFGITMSFIQGTVPTASIEEDVTTQDVLPTYFALASIYPNPFNPKTNITYDIPEESHISISIYDLSGRKLEDLVNTTVHAGRFNTTWNAEQYSSGLYIINMTTPNYTTSQKVVLLK